MVASGINRKWLIDIKLKLNVALRHYEKFFIATHSFNILEMGGQ